jgi:hypothetical protein
MSNSNLENKKQRDLTYFKKFYFKFGETEYGKKLEKEIRYERFKPDSISSELWEQVLGPDVNNLKHHLVSYDITNDFLRYDGKYNFDYREKKFLIISSIMHDWGESIVGDVVFDHKNDEHEKREFLALQKILNEINFNEDDRVDFQESFEKVLKGKDEKLSITFNAIERLGYLFTGIRAWQKGYEILSKDKVFSESLWWLANNVALNQAKKLIEYGESYGAVKFYLNKNEKIVSEIFSKMPKSIFLKYEKKESIERMKQFDEAKEIWEKSIK